MSGTGNMILLMNETIILSLEQKNKNKTEALVEAIFQTFCTYLTHRSNMVFTG